MELLRKNWVMEAELPAVQISDNGELEELSVGLGALEALYESLSSSGDFTRNTALEADAILGGSAYTKICYSSSTAKEKKQLAMEGLLSTIWETVVNGFKRVIEFLGAILAKIFPGHNTGSSVTESAKTISKSAEKANKIVKPKTPEAVKKVIKSEPEDVGSFTGGLRNYELVSCIWVVDGKHTSHVNTIKKAMKWFLDYKSYSGNLHAIAEHIADADLDAYSEKQPLDDLIKELESDKFDTTEFAGYMSIQDNEHGEIVRAINDFVRNDPDKLYNGLLEITADHIGRAFIDKLLDSIDVIANDVSQLKTSVEKLNDKILRKFKDAEEVEGTKSAQVKKLRASYYAVREVSIRYSGYVTELNQVLNVIKGSWSALEHLNKWCDKKVAAAKAAGLSDDEVEKYLDVLIKNQVIFNS